MIAASTPSDRPFVLLWLRREMRLEDHPALVAALAEGSLRDRPVAAVFVLPPPGHPARLGGAALWWLHHSLQAFAAALERLNIPLILRRGDPVETLLALVRDLPAATIHGTARCEPWESEAEQRLREQLPDGIRLDRHPGQVLTAPGSVVSSSGTPFKVFTPFLRALRAEEGRLRRPIAAPEEGQGALPAVPVESERLEDWRLLPTRPDWAAGFAPLWTPGEAAARERLQAFLQTGLTGYHERRDLLAGEGTSRLSPHLAHGEVSVATCWQAARVRGEGSEGSAVWMAELAWRDFYAHQLAQHPDLATAPMDPRFARFAWAADPGGARLKAWQQGRTGYPVVDAAMRQLWQTGWMHNRARMITGSFLVKHLLIPWQEGEAWFRDTLLDWDAGSNAGGWQWVAGSGSDAAPFYRIFNPILQGERFDTDGAYVRKYVPELASLPAAVIHKPWTARPETLAACRVRLGRDYPQPMVEHQAARAAALKAFGALKAG